MKEFWDAVREQQTEVITGVMDRTTLYWTLGEYLSKEGLFQSRSEGDIRKSKH